MSGNISSLSTLISNNTTQSQPLALQQQLAQASPQASQSNAYGPPYILSISSGNGASGASEAQAFNADFQQLAQALKSGNLSQAQSAFSALSQLPGVQSALQAQQNGSSNNPFAQALNEIGGDLQSGNLSGAQQAFSALQQLASNSSGAGHVGGHHHHHGGGGKSEASSASSASGSSTDGSSSASGSSTNGTSSSTTDAFTIFESLIASTQPAASNSTPSTNTSPTININITV